MKIARSIGFLTLLSPLLLAPAAANAQCVDVLALADDTVLGNTFTQAGYDFRTAPGTEAFVNVFADANGDVIHGVQFPNAGMGVRLPLPSTVVDIEIGVFATPFVVVRGIDGAGTVVAMAAVPADSALHSITLTSVVPMEKVRFFRGGDEAVVNEICI